MKLTGLKYILLIVACLAIFTFIFRDHMPFGRDNTDFAVKPGSEITGVDLFQGEKKVRIRKTGNDWTVNKKDEARKPAILYLINILKGIRIKSPVSAEVFTAEIVSRNVDPVRVTVYHNNRPLKSYYVYRTPSNKYGNIMKMRISAKPYIVCLPGDEENIGSLFEADELYWMPYSVFRYLPSQIRKVSLKNTAEPALSFEIDRNGRRFSFPAPEISKGYDSLRVRRYISYFTAISFETWAGALNGDMVKSIESGEPSYVITVTTNDGKDDVLRIWERSKEGGRGEKDTDRVWAEKNDGKGVFVMRYFDLDPILKKRSWFFGD
ncbi:MAG TPA: hypothetical protein VMT63_04490 [Bacteroidales bacterium]|nr:hypothetical protein [Bacteroidales bacterium]